MALGGFGGLFDLKAAGFDDPILVAATDGVGTKLELARAVGRYRGLGIDLVAMCVNDLIAQGAVPLFFLDYFATGKLERAIAAEVVAGIADGCVECEAALIGGETAEMPGVYPDGGFDLAGFAVGAAERGTLLSRGMPQEGDVAIALPSSGFTPTASRWFARSSMSPAQASTTALTGSIFRLAKRFWSRHASITTARGRPMRPDM